MISQNASRWNSAVAQYFLPSTLFVASVALGNTATKGFFGEATERMESVFLSSGYSRKLKGAKKKKKSKQYIYRDVYSFICF